MADSNIFGLDESNFSSVAIGLHGLACFGSDSSGGILNEISGEAILGSVEGGRSNTVVGCQATDVDVSNSDIFELFDEAKVFTKIDGAETRVRLYPLHFAFEHIDVSVSADQILVKLSTKSVLNTMIRPHDLRPTRLGNRHIFK